MTILNRLLYRCVKFQIVYHQLSCYVLYSTRILPSRAFMEHPGQTNQIPKSGKNKIKSSYNL
jgi:hypothetical protein